MDPINPILNSGWNHLYIDGKWQKASNDDFLNVTSPSTQESIAKVSAATESDVEAAYEAAKEAQPAWEAMSRDERNALLQATIDEIKDSFNELTSLLAKEGGSAKAKATSEVGISISDFKSAIDLKQPSEETRDSVFVEDKTHHIITEPVGVIGIISPWNYPMHLTTRALAPALALGNTVVVNPASETPISGGLILAQIADKVGFPEGVINVVPGRGSDIGDRMVNHPIPRAISFTGSTSIGKNVASQAANSMSYPTLELGGNGPNIVTPNINIDTAARIGAVGSFMHQGQVCISINRHIVHEDVYDSYVDRLVEHAESLTIGDPVQSIVDLGPVINENQRDKILSLIDQSVQEGATLETGGKAEGLLIEPTVLSGATNDMATSCNEHFGPVAPVIRAGSIEEAIDIANDTNYGLSAAVQCEDDDRAREIADQIDAGMVHINDHPIQDEPNAPFGGVKHSGLGRYNGEWVKDKLLETKWVSVQHSDRDYELLEE
jgi:aldehyde dehydrogenase (NAD+)